MEKEKAEVIIPMDLENPPKEHEIEAAWIVAKHYQCKITFLKPVVGYKIKTPDFEMHGLYWECKSPTSNSRKRCVKRQIDNALAQSKNIIFDARRTKLEDEFLIAQLFVEIQKRHSINKLIFITKNSNPIVLKK